MVHFVVWFAGVVGLLVDYYLPPVVVSSGLVAIGDHQVLAGPQEDPPPELQGLLLWLFIFY